MLAERTSNRRGKHRKAEETKYSNAKGERGHDSVFTISGARKSSQPGVGVGTESLGFARVGFVIISAKAPNSVFTVVVLGPVFLVTFNPQ